MHLSSIIAASEKYKPECLLLLH